MSSLLLIFSFLLLMVWPIPGTIALRHALLAAALCATVWELRGQWRSGERWWHNTPRGAAVPLGFFFAIGVWLLLQARFISDDPGWTLREISGQWGSAGLALILGLALGLFARRSLQTTRVLMTLVISALAAQALFSVLVSIPIYLQSGEFPPRMARWTAGQLEVSYTNNLLLVFACGDLLSRLARRSAVSFVPTAVLAAMLLLACSSNLAFGARNGLLIALLLLLVMATLVALYLKETPRAARALVALVALVAIGATALGISTRTDARWQNAAESARLGWDIDAQHTWHDEPNHPLQKLANGQWPDHSIFMRSAWIHAGLRLVAAHPLGVGFGRNAFGRAVAKYYPTRLGHAHNGVIDWAVGTGVPGVLMWFGWMAVLATLAWRRFFRQHDVLGLILFALVAGGVARMFVDSVMRDHMLQMFFFLIGVLWVTRLQSGPSLDEPA